jgi:nucleotide-binding universal stress UspA family protein
MFKKVLFPLEIHEESSWQRALPVAVRLCANDAANLHLVFVLPQIHPAIAAYLPEGTLIADHRQEVEWELAEFVTKNVPAGLKASYEVLLGDSIYDEVLKCATRIKADLIVLASHRPTASDYLIGPNAARIVRHFSGSVFVVR